MIITTAQIPGRPAPRLITAEAVKGMAPGSVIIDLAAETGGNVEGSKPGETVEENGVKIIGPANLPSQMAGNASALYAKNLQNLVELLIDEEGNLKVDTEDEVIAGALLTKDGEIVNERAKERSSGREAEEPIGPDDRDHDLRPRRLRRLRGDLEGADHPAHAADVADQRDPRHRHARRADRDRLRRRHAGEGDRRDRDRLRHDQHRRRLHGHRPDARHVPAAGTGSRRRSPRPRP